MSKLKNIEELREFILYLEDKYNLLDFEIDGVKPWQSHRVQIDYALGRVSGLMSVPHTRTSLKDKFLNSFSIIKSMFYFNPFFSKPVDIIVFPHSRVKNVDGEFIDIYTHYFTNKLARENKNFIEIECPHFGKHYKIKTAWRYHLDFILVLVNIFSRFIKLKNIDYEFIEKVEKEIGLRIGKYDLKSLFLVVSKKYKVEYFYYNRLFKKLRPKKIYLVVSYSGFAAMIKAAKDLDIEVIEFQHGNFSQYHFGYYFGEEKRELDYFPDKFYVWNKYWKNLINFPIDDSKIIINRFDFLENKKKSYKKIKKIKNKVIVLSQGVLGNDIAEKIIENWDYFQKFNIKYKLHPGEYTRWKDYKSLIELEKKDNVEVLKDIDLYELFSSCEYQVGVFSTALYEGIEFECKTILLNLQGIESMSTFKELYNVKVI